MRRCLVGLGLLALSALIACSDDGGPLVDPGNLGEATERIINGTLDYDHDAVVALAGYNHMCTGTIIEKNLPYLYILTAAHCVAPNAPSDPVQAIQGDDFNSGSAVVYSVEECEDIPGYSGGSLDFGMCRATGAGSGTPVIPAATAPDGLVGGNPGTSITHVGYGKRYVNDNSNTDRYYFDGYITTIDSGEFQYNQWDGGPCSGDSGGPQLAGNPERVVGVTSRGDEYCNQTGISGRVSSVYTSFIRAFIDGTPIGPLTCDQCFSASTSGEGGCVWAVNACWNSSDCNALLECFDGCGTYSCQNACIDSHPSGYESYLEIFECVCSSACASECDGDSMCNLGGTGGSGTGGSGTGNSGTGATGTGGSGTGNTGTGASGNTGTGASASGDGWVAGSADDRKYDGELAGACSLSRAGSRSARPSMILVAGALGLVTLARRRRPR